MAVCLYGYVLPTESASLFFRCSLSFYLAVTFFDTWNIVCFILRLHFFKRNCRCFFRRVDRRLTIFSECAMLAVWPVVFCILSKPVADFQVLSFSYHFLVKSNHFFLPCIKSVFNPNYLLPSSPIKKLQIFLFPASIKRVFISFFMVSPKANNQLLHCKID